MAGEAEHVIQSENSDSGAKRPYALGICGKNHWLGDVDSNHGKQSQNLLSYH